LGGCFPQTPKQKERKSKDGTWGCGPGKIGEFLNILCEVEGKPEGGEGRWAIIRCCDGCGAPEWEKVPPGGGVFENNFTKKEKNVCRFFQVAVQGPKGGGVPAGIESPMYSPRAW